MSIVAAKKRAALAIAAAVMTAGLALCSAAAAMNDNQHTPPNEIPPYKEGDVIHTEAQFEKFLDLMLTATGPRHAFEIAKDKFGRFPLRFEGENFRIMIVSFRHHFLHVRSDCSPFPMIKAEYVTFDATTDKPITVGWIFVYPKTGPIVKDDINGMRGVTLQEAMTNGSGFFSRGGVIQHGAVLRDGAGPDFGEYCKEAGRPLSYPRY
jgi:hypothetical protein